MPHVIENGTQVANATSYVSLLDVRAYAVARGLTFTEDDTLGDGYVQRAMDVAESESYLGERVSSSQALSWPRRGVYLHGFELSTSTIPGALKNAVCQLSVDLQAQPIDAPTDGRIITQEVIGPLSTTYADSGQPVAQFPAYRRLVRLLLAGSGTLRVYRS